MSLMSKLIALPSVEKDQLELIDETFVKAKEVFLEAIKETETMPEGMFVIFSAAGSNRDNERIYIYHQCGFEDNLRKLGLLEAIKLTISNRAHDTDDE